MRRRNFLALPLLAPAAGVAAAPPRQIVASFSILADMVRQVGDGSVRVTSLVPPDGDAHVYQPRPGDLRTLMAADILVENGLGLEGWMARLGAASQFKGIRVVASSGVVPRTMTAEGGTMTIDPHAWQDPRNGAIYARNIGKALGADNAAARYAAEIERLDTWIMGEFATIPPEARRIVTTHDALGYYGARYGIEFLAAEGISTDSEPSAKAIAALIGQIRGEKVRAAFIETMTDARLVNMLARETGVTIGGTIYSDALSPPGGPAASYLAMLRHNTSLFVRALR